MELLQDIILNKFIVVTSLGIVFLLISRWAVLIVREYLGYTLGWLLGLFFMIVYLSLGGGQNGMSEEPQYLGIFHVLLASFFGLVFGTVIQLGSHFGTRMAQGLALQVALFTSLGMIVIFLAIMESPTTHRMIGIFALAVGIASLFGMVLFPTAKREQELMAMSYKQPISNPEEQLPQVPLEYPQENLRQSGVIQMSRLDEIRQRKQHEQ